MRGGRWRSLAAGALSLVLVGLAVVWLTWPDVASLSDTSPGTTAFIDRYLERTGRSAADWTWVPASRISAHLMEAVVVAEDIEFFSHDGFSRYEIDQAIRTAIRERERPRGASTITQQLAKNLWLSPSRNLQRKLRETLLTRQLERHLSKARILEIYLNVVEFGPGVFGAEAAALRYFEKSAADLTQRESAMLAASLPRPSQWHPGVASPNYARRLEALITRMREVTFLDRRLGLPVDPVLDPEPDPDPAPPAEP
ncbi:MAG: monofunctional biosynthetic peptidoglycan transglycosylase [Gemmatimonadota bacterium]